MWDSGYVSEVNYVHGYFGELAPERLKLALLSRGVAHTVSDNPNYLELGFGQGLSLAINAATNSGNYYGTDFNPGQVANAQELASASGSPIQLFEQSFQDLAERQDLPDFDIIALHGIWSWVSDEARSAILKIASKHLKPGGIFYISYNVTPGWSPAVPLRHLLSQHSKRAGAGGILHRVEQSIEFVESVMDANALYFESHPQLRQRLDQIKKQDKAYVSHEYFNAHWDPMPFSNVADMLSEAKLSFGASANILDNLEAISIPEPAREVLSKISDPVLRETTIDYFTNQQFRRDIFVKGPRPIADFEMVRIVDATKFIALAGVEKRPTKIPTAVGEADLMSDVYEPVATVLASLKGTSISIAEMLADPRCKNLNRAQVWEAMMVLTSVGFAAPAVTSETSNEVIRASQALNRFICERAEYSENMQFLAAPTIGSAIGVSRIDQLFLRGEYLGAKNIPKWVWELLESQGQRLMKKDKPIESVEENIEKLGLMYKEFKAERYSILIAVKAIEG